MIIAIDPGNKESGICILDGYRPYQFCKIDNDSALEFIDDAMATLPIEYAIIEMVASYGMAVGQTVFDTCVWIGRFMEFIRAQDIEVKTVKRKEYVVDFCGTPRAKDANITQYLIDRFAPDTPNRGKGTKKAPGIFYGFKADIWQAYAIGVWARDNEKNGR